MRFQVHDKVIHTHLKSKGIGIIIQKKYSGTEFENVTIRWYNNSATSSYNLNDFCPIKLYKKRLLKLKLP